VCAGTQRGGSGEWCQKEVVARAPPSFPPLPPLPKEALSTSAILGQSEGRVRQEVREVKGQQGERIAGSGRQTQTAR